MKELALCRARLTTPHSIICDDLNLIIKPGSTWGILGPNGCGKTTLLHALAGLNSLSSGDIMLENIALQSLSRKTIAQSLGILLQDFSATFPQTVWDYCLGSRFPYLAYLKKETAQDKEIALDALRSMQLEALLRRNIIHLSGGEKRRLAIAGLLTQNPAIYLLDEPTNHLDVRQQMAVLNHFKQLALQQSASVVMALHDINLAQQFCDHILMLLPEGEAIHGTTESMLTSALLSRLYQYPMKKIVYENKAYFTIRTANDD